MIFKFCYRLIELLTTETFPHSTFLLQEDKFAVKSEECKNFDEHVDIKHQIKPNISTSATTSEVRQECECCNFSPHIHIFR